MIHIYPNRFSATYAEQHAIAEPLTFKAWLKRNVKSFKEGLNPPFKVWVNDEWLSPGQWDEQLLQPTDSVSVILEPKDAATAIIAVVSLIAGAAVTASLTRKVADNYNATTPKGSSIYDVNLQSNKARLNGIIPELAGEHGWYPDALSLPHRYYDTLGRACMDVLLCISVGNVQLESDNLRIAQTPINRYADAISYQIFGPGESLASNKAQQIWFQSNEISEQVKLESVPRMFYGNNSRMVYVDGNRFGVKLYGMSDRVREWPFAVDDLLLFNGIAHEIIRFKGLVTTVDMMISSVSGEGLQVFSVGQTVIVMGLESGNGVYKVVDVLPSGGRIALTDMDGNLAKLPLMYSRYVHIAVSVPNHVLGLYKVLEVNSTQSMFTVEKLGEPGWTGFPPQYDHYTTTLISPVTPTIASYTIGPYLVCPEYEKTTRIEIDFFVPGLGRAESDGSISTVTLEVEIRYRMLGTAAWQKRYWLIHGNSFDEFGATQVINVPLGAYEVEIERRSAQSGDLSERDTAYCTRLKSRMSAPTSYKGVTTLALSIVGNNALSEAAENKIFVKPTRKLPVRKNGVWLPEAPTRSVADFFAYMLRDIGFEWMLALPEFDELVASTALNGQTFNAVFDNESTVNDAMRRILAVAYAEPLLDFGQIVPFIERPRTHFGQMFCPDNYTKGLKIDINLFKPDEADGVEVEYMDPVTWKPATVLCTLPGDAGIKPEKVRMFGVTDKTQAWRLGMRERRRMRYIRKGFTFQTEMDGLNAKYGSLCPLADNILNQSGRLKGYLNRVLTLNQPLRWTAGQQHVIGIRRPNGTLAGPYSCTPGATEYNAVIAQSLDFVPDFSGQQEPPFFIFGIKDKWAHMAIPRSITPSGTDKVKLVCENYDERIFINDNDLSPF